MLPYLIMLHRPSKSVVLSVRGTGARRVRNVCSSFPLAQPSSAALLAPHVCMCVRAADPGHTTLQSTCHPHVRLGLPTCPSAHAEPLGTASILLASLPN